MKHAHHLTLSLLTLCIPYIYTNACETHKEKPVHVELSAEVIAKRNALVKEIEQVCIDFYESENRKALDDFRYDQTAKLKSINGTPEEVERAFREMYLTHASAHLENIAVHCNLEKIEKKLIETGLSEAEAYLISMEIMDKIFIERRDPERLQRLQENIKKQHPSFLNQERRYAFSLLYQLGHGQYESEGQRLILGMQARNTFEHIYIYQKYAPSN